MLLSSVFTHTVLMHWYFIGVLLVETKLIQSQGGITFTSLSDIYFGVAFQGNFFV